MPRSESPPVTRPASHRFPRRAGRRDAPSLPFSDPAAVLDALRTVTGPVVRDGHVVTVACGRHELSGLAARLSGAGLAARPAGAGVAGLRVVIRVAGVPDAGPRDVAALAAAGVAAVELAGETVVDDAVLPEWIELNKAALRYRLPMAWSGRLPGRVGDRLVHLVPARDQPDWRRRWRYGMLGWRLGPGFCNVVDARDEVRQLTISLPVVADLFGPGLDRPVPVDHADPGIVEELAGAGLVMTIGDRVVWLPYRIRSWPVSALF